MFPDPDPGPARPGNIADAGGHGLFAVAARSVIPLAHPPAHPLRRHIPEPSDQGAASP